MSDAKHSTRPPSDAKARRAVAPVICYPTEGLPKPDLDLLQAARIGATKTGEVLVPARDARCFEVPAGHFFRISSVEGPQVGDLNCSATLLVQVRDIEGG